MTISRVKPANWSTGEKLTSNQLNQLDTNTAAALDKRSGQTDTLQSVVTLSGAGRFVEKLFVGPNADQVFLVSGANSIILAPNSLTSNRFYDVGATNAIAGDRITILNQSQTYGVQVRDAASVTPLTFLAPLNVGYGPASFCDVVYNGTAWVLLRSSTPFTYAPTLFTSSGTYTVPPGVTKLCLVGCGGGGGGGGGGTAGTTASVASCGGGGGGGAQLVTRIVTVTPGSTYSFVIGTGGTGGGPNAHGSDGANTTFDTLFTARGGGGGSAGGSPNVIGYIVRGGAPVAYSYNANFRVPEAMTGAQVAVAYASAGAGGPSINDSTITPPGVPSVQGFAGGAPGTRGGSSGSYLGGAGGGGGGGGPGGVGANGGNGGNANNAGAGTAGSAGSSASAGTGAGGGGGGAGGNGSASGGSAGGGGNGGGGFLSVAPVW